MPNLKLAEEWLTFAKKNLATAILLNRENHYTDVIAFDIQQACGTGLEACMLVANKIALGHIESGIAGGVDTTSDAPKVASRQITTRRHHGTDNASDQFNDRVRFLLIRRNISFYHRLRRFLTIADDPAPARFACQRYARRVQVKTV